MQSFLQAFMNDPVPQKMAPPSRSSMDDMADVRDILANFVGGGHKTFNDDLRKDYARLQVMLGPQQAQQLLNHVFVFNNRPEVQQKTPEGRLDFFYNTPSAHEDVGQLLSKVKSFGQGPVVGLDESVNVGNKKLTGRWPMAVPPVVASNLKNPLP